MFRVPIKIHSKRTERWKKLKIKTVKILCHLHKLAYVLRFVDILLLSKCYNIPSFPKMYSIKEKSEFSRINFLDIENGYKIELQKLL